MRPVDRQDAPVLLGLVAAVFLTFLNPLARIIQPVPTGWARGVFALMPGLVLLLVVLGVDRWRRRSALGTSDAEMRQAESAAVQKSADLDRFLDFNRALATAVDAAGVTAAIEHHLAAIVGTDAVSVLLNQPSGWEMYAGDHGLADQVLARVAVDPALTSGPATVSGDDSVVPLRSAGQTVGALIVRRPSRGLGPDSMRLVEAAAALLAVALQNLRLFRELHETNLRDPLTGCASRAHGVDVIEGEVRRARRSHQPVSLLLVDVDHLKDINSRYGYLCGDAVLATVGRRLRELLRRSDLKCRYGGEEFVVLLPETALLGARRVAETLRREIADRPMPWNGDQITVTASIGVTQALAGEINVIALIARAAVAAARAQDEGHNTVRVASDALASLQQVRQPEKP